MMNKIFKVSVEVRYYVNGYDGDKVYRTVKNLIGVYDDQDQALNAGNEALRELEKLFPMHVFPNGQEAPKQRLSRIISIVSNLAYLKTPFDFYMEIETIFKNPIEEFVGSVLADLK